MDLTGFLDVLKKWPPKKTQKTFVNYICDTNK